MQMNRSEEMGSKLASFEKNEVRKKMGNIFLFTKEMGKN